jgi:hypothetical protein
MVGEVLRTMHSCRTLVCLPVCRLLGCCWPRYSWLALLPLLLLMR